MKCSLQHKLQTVHIYNLQHQLRLTRMFCSVHTPAPQALLYAERGARLLLTARREAELKSLQRECLALGAAEAIVVAADVSNTSAILAPLAATRRTLALLLQITTSASRQSLTSPKVTEERSQICCVRK